MRKRAQRPRSRRFAYRDVTLTDARGRTLAFAGQIVVTLDRGRGGTVGIANPHFAPGGLRRLAAPRGVTVRVTAAGVMRLTLRGLRVFSHLGDIEAATGEMHADAVVAVVRSALRHPVYHSKRSGMR